MQRGISLCRKGLLAALVVAACSTTGCVDPGTAAQFSGIADGLRTTLPRVTDDISATCQRRNVVRAEMPAAEGAAAPLDCAPYDAVARTLAQDQQMLAAYLNALAQIAVNRPVLAGPALAASQATVGSLGALSVNTIVVTEAAEKIGGILAAAATQRYREKRLNELIAQADPAVQQLCAALIKVVKQDYDLLLVQERNDVSDAYDAPIAARKETAERLTLLLVYRQRDNDLARVAVRRAAIADYVDAVTAVSKLHAQLAADARKRANLRQMAEEAGPAVSSLKDAVDTLKARLK